MKIKYLGLLSCLLICSCNLIRDENYYNVNKDDIREYSNEEFAINIRYVLIFDHNESLDKSPKSFDPLRDEGFMYLTFGIGNIRSKEDVNVKAVSKIKMLDESRNIIFEKKNIIDDFFNFR